MALILNCDRCNKRMKLLDPHHIVENQYVCASCFNSIQADKENKRNIEEFYDNLDPAAIPFIGFWKRPEYDYIKNYATFITTADATSLYTTSTGSSPHIAYISTNNTAIAIDIFTVNKHQEWFVTCFEKEIQIRHISNISDVKGILHNTNISETQFLAFLRLYGIKV